MQFPKWVIIAGLQKECRTYYMAKDRCTNPNNKRYKDYGGRGIKFELTSFKDLMLKLGPRPEDYQLDRIDNSGHYTLENVQWSNSVAQNNNKRRGKVSATGHLGIYIHGNCLHVYDGAKYIGSCATLELAIKLKESL